MRALSHSQYVWYSRALSSQPVKCKRNNISFSLRKAVGIPVCLERRQSAQLNRKEDSVFKC